MASPGFGFRDRTVLVTGASSGIGRETALAFAAAGANVVLVARRAKVLAKVAAECRKAGAETLIAAADVAQAEAVAGCFRKAVKRFGSVDVVVNNAGVLIPANVVDMRTADLQRMLDVNLIGALAVNTHLFGLRASVSFTTNVLTAAYVQYNSSGELAAVHLRFNYIYRSIDNVYLVYNDTRYTGGRYQDRANRSLVFKATYSVHR